MVLSEMNHQPPDKILWITFWGWHKIRKRKWPDQCEMLFQVRRKRDTSLCTLNRRKNSCRCNICHKQGSNHQHCSKRQLPSPSTHLRFWDTQQDLKWEKRRKKKKERRTLISLQYSTWHSSLRVFPRVHSVIEKILTRYSLKSSKQLYWHLRKIREIWQSVYHNIQST